MLQTALHWSEPQKHHWWQPWQPPPLLVLLWSEAGLPGSLHAAYYLQHVRLEPPRQV